eukprot:CAMPEP_0184857494 /NCGR_PEP_ID=MMETSP0580-20130426/2640_1 /TAXON_ID=1118495 /ORGANISM="Dactyliosolen fragilissimus" /LENGTH=495 /DNA_ID=CAMNT_0027353115 /DNA_START=91 /DNA_END=1578 /DNA_ORIENTATION=+
MNQINQSFVHLSVVLFFISFAANAHDMCVDNPFEFKVSNKMKRCSQFNQSKKQCRKNKTVKKNCPRTCGLCEELCLDHVANNDRLCSFLEQKKRICIQDDVFQAICPLVCQVEWTQLGNDIDGKTANAISGYSVSMSADGLIVAIGAPSADNIFTNAGHVSVFKHENNDWTQLGSDIDGEAACDWSGRSIALSADGLTVAIGAYGSDANGDNSGHVRIFKYDSNDWTQLGSDIDGEAASDRSGKSVSISEDGLTVAIGANYNSSRAGHVRIYKYEGNDWIQLGSDIDGDSAKNEFGYSVSISSNGLTVAIGAPYYNKPKTGHVRIFKYVTNDWTQLGSDIVGEAAHDNSGQAVSISADGLTVAIGADYNDGNGWRSGHVRIYKYVSNDWTQLGSDIDGEKARDFSGNAVSLSADGQIVAIGARWNNGNGFKSGHVRIYKYGSNDWTQLGSDIDGEAGGDQFGYSVSISDDGLIVAIGAISNRDGYHSGYVRVYSL